MNTLYARLFVSAASIGIAVMAVFIIVLSLVGGPLISRPIAQSLDAAAANVRTLASSAPRTESFDVLLRRILENTRTDEVNIAIIPSPEAQRVPPAPVGPIDIGTALGIRGKAVRVGDNIVLIIPANDRLNAAVRAYLALVAIAVLVSLGISLAAARWSARHAISPLLAVTSELERFALGDFREQTLRTNERGEVGALTTAFNGAARQVARSFEERERVENRMRQFVADASHELRTPMTIVGGFIDVMRRGGLKDEQMRENVLARMSSENARMRRLVDRLIVLARMERLPTVSPEVVELGDVVCEAIASRAVENAIVTFDRSSGATYIRADPSDIFEAVGNLIENATKYGSGASVSIERVSGTAIVHVRDRGPGIDVIDAERIFERFYRGEATRSVAGSGLGLTIAQNAARRAGGTLALENANAGETTFTLRFSLLEAANGVSSMQG